MIENRQHSSKENFVVGSSRPETKEKPTRRQILMPRIKLIIDGHFPENLKDEKWPERRNKILYFLLGGGKETKDADDIDINKESWQGISEKITKKLDVLETFSPEIQSEVIKGYMPFKYACGHPDGKTERDTETSVYASTRSQGYLTSRLRSLTKDNFGQDNFVEKTFFKKNKVNLQKKSDNLPKKLPDYVIKMPENNKGFTEIDYLKLSPSLREIVVNEKKITSIARLDLLWGEEILLGKPTLKPNQSAEIYDKIHDFHQMIIEAGKKNPGEVIVFPFSEPKREEVKPIKQKIELVTDEKNEEHKLTGKNSCNIEIIFGMNDSLAPSSKDFMVKNNNFISPSKALKEIGIKFEKVSLYRVLQKIFENKDINIPVFLYSNKSLIDKGSIGVYRICGQDKEIFQKLAMNKKEEINKIFHEVVIFSSDFKKEKVKKPARKLLGEVKRIFGPLDSVMPSNGSFFGKNRELIPPSKILKEIGLKFSPKHLSEILEEMFSQNGEISLYLYTSPGLSKGKSHGVYGIHQKDKEIFQELAVAKRERIIEISYPSKPVKEKIIKEKSKLPYVKEIEDLLKDSEITLDYQNMKKISRWFTKGEEIGFKFNRETKIALLEFYFKSESKKLTEKKKKINPIEEEGQELKSEGRRKVPVILESEEVNKLLEQPSRRYPTGLRNRAMMVLMLHCGLRISEVTNLTSENLDIAKEKLRIEGGEKINSRSLDIPRPLIHLLNSWEEKRPNSGFFFSTLKGKKLSNRYLEQMVKRYAQKAGINKVISPYTLRHTYATQFYRQTKDIEALRRILGHSDLSTTSIYLTSAKVDVEKSMKSFRGFL